MLLSLCLGLLPLALAQFSQPNPCVRWAGQGALVNKTMYYYGGQATLTPNVIANSWTNALLSVDLARDWPIGQPALRLLQPDSGNPRSPPAVSLGTLWPTRDQNTLAIYGGYFSDTPNVPPPAFDTFGYDIQRNRFSVLDTRDEDGITRVAEGSGTTGGTGNNTVGYYFSGHIDSHTEQGWSNQIARIYLNSLLTFDLTSYTYRNISTFSSGSKVTSNSVPEIAPIYRADGTLTWVPGLGSDPARGILVSIGGATERQFVDNSVLDVFDIGSNGWTKQATVGFPIGNRINHCAVRTTKNVGGIDYSQIFIYGGSQLNGTDRDSAVFVLTLPSFTWTTVDKGGILPSQPTGRAGHVCALDGNQMVIIGGVISRNLLCDQPGIYVFNVSSLSWATSFTANSVYTTPTLLANITGGDGLAVTTNGGNGGGSSGSKPNAGAIAGGVVGGLLGLLAILLAIFLYRRRQREQHRKEAESDLVAGRRFSGSTTGMSNEKGSPPLGPYSSVRHSLPASDDVEDQTAGMAVAFGSHLVPKRTLRVTNPEA